MKIRETKTTLIAINLRNCSLNFGYKAMKTKEKISINEFDGKRFQIRLVEPNDENKAVLTHYLHNINNGVSKYYKKDAFIFDDFRSV